jgi:hypothetical protein
VNTIHATILDGKIIPDTPVELPNGTRVEINPLTPDATIPDDAPDDSRTTRASERRRLLVGDLPDDNDTSPEAIAKRLALMDRVQPWMTPEEFAEWERVRAQDKAFQLSQWEKWAKEIGGIFE